MDDQAVSIRNQILRELPATELSVVRANLKEFSPPKGAVLQEPGRKIEAVLFPETALLLLWVALGDGASVGAGLIGREEAFGMEAEDHAATAVVRAAVQFPGSILYIEAEAFRDLLSNCSGLRAAVRRHACRMQGATYQLVACNAVHDVRKRLSRCLSDAFDRVDGGPMVFTQQTLARMLGVRRTTVTFVLGQLEQDGLISQSRARIEVLDHAGLRRSSCECYGSIGHASALSGPAEGMGFRRIQNESTKGHLRLA